MTALTIRNMERTAEAMERAMGWDAHARSGGRTPIAHGPAMDIVEKGEMYEVRLELPGTAREDINLESSSGVLSVSGKVRDREFRRSIALPSWAAIDKIEARLVDGVLVITVPKREEEKSRVITVQ